jgi:tRNA (mo5U34)-methyltransferase
MIMTDYPAGVLKEINSKTWFHSFELLPGLWSPGRLQVRANEALDSLGIQSDLTGKRVIDIGALDGAYSFEFARRNASTLAVDIQDPDRTGFNVTRKLKGAKVEYLRKSVYDLNPQEVGLFDIVWYWGVYYHLKEPLIGFRNIFNILKDSGLLYYEGEILDAAFVHEPSLRKYEKIFRQAKDLPLAYFTSRDYAKDPSNWYIPNAVCLREWLLASGFVNISMVVNSQDSRALGKAQKDPESWITVYEYPFY